MVCRLQKLRLLAVCCGRVHSVIRSQAGQTLFQLCYCSHPSSALSIQKSRDAETPPHPQSLGLAYHTPKRTGAAGPARVQDGCHFAIAGLPKHTVVVLSLSCCHCRILLSVIACTFVDPHVSASMPHSLLGDSFSLTACLRMPMTIAAKGCGEQRGPCRHAPALVAVAHTHIPVSPPKQPCKHSHSFSASASFCSPRPIDSPTGGWTLGAGRWALCTGRTHTRWRPGPTL
jgi:hypothetical protein